MRDGTYTIRELYEALAIYSANAATIAIAETIAGTETEFLKLMNAKAEELGLKDYKFVNSTGLNNSDLTRDASSKGQALRMKTSCQQNRLQNLRIIY